MVRLDGRIRAFATLWTTPDESLFSIDLMRYDPEAPKDVMDYLFIELLLWGQRQATRPSSSAWRRSRGWRTGAWRR